MSGTSRRNDYTVGWICGSSIELAAAIAMLDQHHPDLETRGERDDNAYTLGRIKDHNVVITSLPAGQKGQAPAAAAARDMVNAFPKVRFGLLVGVGGGVPSDDNDIRLGDVVVSQPTSTFGGVVQYKEAKGTIKQLGALNSPPTQLLTALAKLQGTHQLKDPELVEHYRRFLGALQPKGQRTYKHPDNDSDRLFHSSYEHPTGSRNCSRCDKSKLIDRDPPEQGFDIPGIHYGLIACSNDLVEDAILRDTLKDALNVSRDADILCFEEEAAGLMNTFPCLVIRGISDYSDTHSKSTKAVWEGYAAAMAASYAKEFLYVIPRTHVMNVEPAINVMVAVVNASNVQQGRQGQYGNVSAGYGSPFQQGSSPQPSSRKYLSQKPSEEDGIKSVLGDTEKASAQPVYRSN